MRGGGGGRFVLRLGGGGEVGFDLVLACRENIADARQRDLGHQQIERAESDRQPDEFTREIDRVEGRKSAFVSGAAGNLGSRVVRFSVVSH